MLHIILGILKIIGILLGILLLLLLAGLLALVFVPLRYRLALKVQPGQYAFSLRGSWLLHAVSAEVGADSSRGRRIDIRLFGIRLPLFRTDNVRKEAARGGGKKKPSGAKPGHAKADRAKSKRKEQKRTEARHEEPNRAESEHREPDHTESKREEPNRAELKHTEPENGRQEERPSPEAADAGDTGQEADSPKRNILGKIRFQWERICDKIRQITEGIRRFRQKLIALKQRVSDLARKLIALLHKPGELLAFLEKYEVREVFGNLVGHLTFLIAHYKPRRIEGYLRFGTDNPAVTGQLTGLIYMLLPARADRFSVEPEFAEAVFETETVCSGHIRAVHVLRVLWRGFHDKKLRRMIDVYRGSGRRR